MTARSLIPNSFKKRIAEIIEEQGLSKLDFAINEEIVEWSLAYKNSDLFFTFQFDVSDYSMVGFHYSVYSMEKSRVDSKTYLKRFQVYDVFEAWLGTNVLEFKLDQETADPWSTVQQETNDFLFGGDVGGNDEYFSQEEQVCIEAAVNGLRVVIPLQTGVSDSEQLSAMNKKLDFVVSELKSSKKENWKFLFYGTVIGLAVDLLKDREKSLALVQFIVETVVHAAPSLLNTPTP
jgi:hypothetical protein